MIETSGTGTPDDYHNFGIVRLGKHAADHVAAGQPAESGPGTARGVRRLAGNHGSDVLALGGYRTEVRKSL